MQALEPQAGETLERMLARYARVRLDPSATASRRARAAVMEEAWRRRLDLADAGAGSPAIAAAVSAPRHHRGLFAGWGARRISASLAAALLAGLLLGSSVLAASRAGGPLYDTRLAAGAPASALGGLDRALANSDTAIERLTATEAGQPGNGAGSGDPNGNANGGGNANGNPNAGGTNSGGNANVRHAPAGSDAQARPYP